MIGLAGILLFGFSALWLMAAAMSDAPYAADDVAHLALIGLVVGFALIVVQIVVWLCRLL